MRVSLFNSIFFYTDVSSDDTISVRGSLELTAVVCRNVSQLSITLIAICVGMVVVLSEIIEFECSA